MGDPREVIKPVVDDGEEAVASYQEDNRAYLATDRRLLSARDRDRSTEASLQATPWSEVTGAEIESDVRAGGFFSLLPAPALLALLPLQNGISGDTLIILLFLAVGIGFLVILIDAFSGLSGDVTLTLHLDDRDDVVLELDPDGLGFARECVRLAT